MLNVCADACLDVMHAVSGYVHCGYVAQLRLGSIALMCGWACAIVMTTWPMVESVGIKLMLR